MTTFAQRLRALVEWSTYQDSCPVSISCDAAFALCEVLEAYHDLLAQLDKPFRVTTERLRLRAALVRLNKGEC